MKILLSTLIASSVLWSLSLNEIPKEITLEDSNGGLVDGQAWSSSMLKEKVNILFYIDPDEKDMNQKFKERLREENIAKEKLEVSVILNLSATWIPNFAIEKSLEEAQKKDEMITFIKDKKRILVKEWELQDEASSILIFDKEGKLIYQNIGELSSSEIEKIMKLIEESL